MLSVQVMDSRPEIVPWEGSSLKMWRRASVIAFNNARYTTGLMEDFLMLGGPHAIKGLKRTVSRLECSISQLKESSKLQRFSQLQKQLEEADRVKAALSALLTGSFKVDEASLQLHLKNAVLTGAEGDRLYGASRELLLVENRALRSQLEQRLVTEKTSWLSGSASLHPDVLGSSEYAEAGMASGGQRDQTIEGSRGAVNDRKVRGPAAAAGGALPAGVGGTGRGSSRLDRARVMAGPQVEALEQLSAAMEDLRDAERSYKLPLVCNAAVEADDGSLKTIKILNSQVSELAGQKGNLLLKVANLEQDMGIVEKRLEQALNEAAEERRQRVEMLTHRTELSKDLRATLESESRRADAAELALQEAGVCVGRQDAELIQQREKLSQATVQLAALEAALQEKLDQLDDLRGLYRELHGQLEKLSEYHETNTQDVIKAVEEHHKKQAVSLKGTYDAASEAKTAAKESARLAAASADLQRELQRDMVAHKSTADAALGALERQLSSSQVALQGADMERRQEARRVIAAVLLTKMEDRHHTRMLKALAADVPAAVSSSLASQMNGIQHRVDNIADDVALANQQISYLTEGGVSGGLHTAYNSTLADDDTSRLLLNSQTLRAELHAMTSSEVTPPSKLGTTTALPAQGLADPSQSVAGQKAAAERSLEQMVGSALLDDLRQRGGLQRPDQDLELPPEVMATVGAAVLDNLRGQQQQLYSTPVVKQQLSQLLPSTLVDAVGTAVLDSIEEEARKQVRMEGTMLLAPGQPPPPPPMPRSMVEAAVGAVVLHSLNGYPQQQQQQIQYPEQLSAAVGAAALEDMRLLKQAQHHAAARAVGIAAFDSLEAQHHHQENFSTTQFSQPSEVRPTLQASDDPDQMTSHHALTLREQLEKLLDQQDIEASHKRLKALQNARDQMMKGNQSGSGGKENAAYIKDKQRQELFHSKIAFPASDNVVHSQHLNPRPSTTPQDAGHEMYSQQSTMLPLPLEENLHPLQNQQPWVQPPPSTAVQKAAEYSGSSVAVIPRLPDGLPPAAALIKLQRE